MATVDFLDVSVLAHAFRRQTSRQAGSRWRMGEITSNSHDARWQRRNHRHSIPSNRSKMVCCLTCLAARVTAVVSLEPSDRPADAVCYSPRILHTWHHKTWESMTLTESDKHRQAGYRYGQGGELAGSLQGVFASNERQD